MTLHHGRPLSPLLSQSEHHLLAELPTSHQVWLVVEVISPGSPFDNHQASQRVMLGYFGVLRRFRNLTACARCRLRRRAAVFIPPRSHGIKQTSKSPGPHTKGGSTFVVRGARSGCVVLFRLDVLLTSVRFEAPDGRHISYRDGPSTGRIARYALPGAP